MTHYEKEFTALFNKISPHYRRSEVFRDFITIFALEMYLIFYKQEANNVLKERYQHAVQRYNEEERQQLCQLYVIVVNALTNQSYDFLGSVFMELDLGDNYKSQYFTPPYVAEAMAKITLNDCTEHIKNKGFITVQEPTCGSGVMLIGCFNHLREMGFNPQQQMWVRAQDVDFTAAMMCYIQMSLLGIPGEIIIGDTLTGEVQHHLYTFQHILGAWDIRLMTVESETQQVNLYDPSLDEDLQNEVIFY